MNMMLTSVFDLYWCTEAVFCKACLTAKVILIAILREQTERGKRNKTLARKKDKKKGICGWLVPKFKGMGLAVMCKCVKWELFL